MKLASVRTKINNLYQSAKSLLESRQAWKRFWLSYRQYQAIAKSNATPEYRESITLYPCIWDATKTTSIEPTYFYQDSWAFELIVKSLPSKHVDVGSHHKYVALLSKVIPVTMVDIRPLSLPLNSLDFKEGSILDLPFADNSVTSLSSLCVIEHIGLGRYGDPLDINGSIKACHELSRVMRPGGNLYVSVPVESSPTTYFNAHRSFNESDFLALFEGFLVQHKAYIYGECFTDERRDSFGVGCYHLLKMAEEDLL